MFSRSHPTRFRWIMEITVETAVSSSSSSSRSRSKNSLTMETAV